MSARLAALVVTHNRLDQLKLTVARLLESVHQELDVVLVVDNASSDGTREWLARQTDARLEVIHLDENTGGAGGFATGVAALRDQHDPDWMVLMDDDARPQPGALAAFHALDKSDYDALAAAVYLPTGEICEMNRPSRNPFWAGRTFWSTARKGRSGFHVRANEYAGSEITPIDVTSFVGFFISRAGLAQAGLPDAGLFLYGDDAIYTLKLSAAGGQIGFAPQVPFTHALTTFSAADKRFRPLWKVYYYHRNLLILYRLAAGRWFYPALAVILPKWLAAVRAHEGERRAYLRLLRRAIADGLAGRRDVVLEQVQAWAGLPLASKTPPD